MSGDGTVQICGVWLSLCVCGFWKGCGGTLVGNDGIFPTGMWLVFVGKPACSHIWSCGLGVQCLNTVVAFFSCFSLSLVFSLFAQFSIRILFPIVFFSLCL